MQTVEQLSRKLTDSGLMSVEQLKEFCDTLPPDQELQAADDLSFHLVKHDWLTEYQVDALTSDGEAPLVVGDYVVLEKIGAGGMGVVFKAQHRRMKRNVALKMLPQNFSQDEGAMRRFEREVEVAAKLNHPNIVTALDAREQQGNHYLIMEFVPGRAFSTVIHEQGVLDTNTAAQYILQAAIGLAHAHQRGVIHRDIKPSNLMLGDDEVVKILDMGLARFDLPNSSSPANSTTDLTNAGVIMGTLDYVSPEQALDSRKVDHRTDIYSLGCTLHYFLLGKPIYGGQTAMEKLVAHRERPIPSLFDARPEVPPDLDAIFQRMVAKNVDDRFQTMGDVVAALQAFLGSAAEPILPAEPFTEPFTEPIDASIAEPIVVATEPKSDLANNISKAVSGAVSGVVSGVVAGVVAGVKSPAPFSRRDQASRGDSYSSLDPPGSSATGQRGSSATGQRTMSGSASESRFAMSPNQAPPERHPISHWKQSVVLMTGRITGLVLGVFAGIGMNYLLGGMGIAIGILLFLWLGWKGGAGYARMLSYHNGWTMTPPEIASGELFRMQNWKLHAVAILIGATVGPWTVGLLGGIYTALAILVFAYRD